MGYPWGDILHSLETGEQDFSVPDDLPYGDLVPDRLLEAAVLVPLRRLESGWEVILTVRTHELRRHAGQISFPGGRSELDDPTRLATALRETEEEIGVEPAHVTPLGCLDPIVTITGYSVFPFVGRVSEAAELRRDAREVAEIFSVPLDFLLDPDNCRTERAFFKGRQREYHVFPYRHYKIWGATAAMLRDLARRFRALDSDG
ncbi:MAG: CoA pyrophosphatase [Xanthomonadales bacterium]|nr:CoA pyrophosphatase [Xanthomonadales bacterium]